MADKAPEIKFIPPPAAVEEITPEKAETYGFWDNDPRVVPEHYVKAFTVNSGPSEATLLLGNTYWESGSRVDLCKMRLVMSHLDFLEFAEDIQKQATFLRKIYGESGPGPKATAEEFEAAWEESFGNS